MPRNAPRANPALFREAFSEARPCYGGACICLTRDERNYQKRVFKIARAWSKRRDELERGSSATGA